MNFENESKTVGEIYPMDILDIYFSVISAIESSTAVRRFKIVDCLIGIITPIGIRVVLSGMNCIRHYVEYGAKAGHAQIRCSTLHIILNNVQI